MSAEAFVEEVLRIRKTKELLESEHGPLQAQLEQVKFLSDEDAARKKALEDEAAQILLEETELAAKINAVSGLAQQIQALIALKEAEALKHLNAQDTSSTGMSAFDALNADDRKAIGPKGVPITSMDQAMILCCQCGIPTLPNDARVCFNCLDVDITANINRQMLVNQCRSCKRYLGENRQWLACEWESSPLLALCLKKVPLKGLRLVEAKFVWTESHSRRIKIQIAVEKEVLNNATLRQDCVIEFVVGHQQCPECTKSVTPHLWISKVQVRQRTGHKRTILFLEQLVLKHGAHSNCVNIVDNPDGMDFCFSKPSHAQQFMEWVQAFFPVDIHATATQQISHDSKSNTYHNKYTTLCEIAPVCRDDLVFLPKKLAILLGGVPRIMLCRKISTGIHLLDPFTLRGVDVDNKKYWTNMFKPFMTRRDLIEFMVLDVQELALEQMKTAGIAGRFLTGMMTTDLEKSTVKKAWGSNSTYRLADVEIARLKDLGQNDTRLHTRTHLGRILKPGDIVLGFDLTMQHIHDDEDEFQSALEKAASQVVLVRKQQAKQVRNWVLRTLPKTVDSSGQAAAKGMTRPEDIEAFKEELDLHTDMREHVAMYKDPRLAQQATQQIARLIEGLTIEDKESFL